MKRSTKDFLWFAAVFLGIGFLIWLVLFACPLLEGQVKVSDMPDDKMSQKIARAMRVARRDDQPSIIMPPGIHNISQTFRASYYSGPSQHPGNLVTNLEIVGNGCILKWTGPKNSAIFDLPSPHSLRVRGLTLDGDDKEGVIGVYLSTGWGYNRNGASQCFFDGVTVRKCDVGFYVGDPLGPDHRHLTWDRCKTQNCKRGWVFEGANITGTELRNCGAYQFTVGVHAIGRGGLSFEDGEVKGPWGKSWKAGRHNTNVWKSRLQKRQGKTLIKGGSPHISIQSFTAHSHKDSVAFFASNANLEIDGARIEGRTCSAFISQGNNFQFETSRLQTTIKDVSCSAPLPSANVVIDGGKPVTIDGGYFSGGLKVLRGEYRLQGEPYFSAVEGAR